MTTQSDATRRSSAPPLQLGRVVRTHREALSWSIHKLAREAGVSPAAVHKVERGQMIPTVRILLKIAHALRQPVARLLEEDEESVHADRYSVMRAGGRPAVSFSEFPVAFQPIVGDLPDQRLEAGIYRVDVGGGPTRVPHGPRTEKLYVVLSGRVRFELEHEAVDLSRGDALNIIRGSVVKSWTNTGDTPCELLCVTTPPLDSHATPEDRAYQENVNVHPSNS